MSLNDWLDLLYLRDKATSREEALFLSGSAKEAIFFRGATRQRKKFLIISNEVGSLIRGKLKNKARRR